MFQRRHGRTAPFHLLCGQLQLLLVADNLTHPSGQAYNHHPNPPQPVKCWEFPTFLSRQPVSHILKFPNHEACAERWVYYKTLWLKSKVLQFLLRVRVREHLQNVSQLEAGVNCTLANLFQIDIVPQHGVFHSCKQPKIRFSFNKNTFSCSSKNTANNVIIFVCQQIWTLISIAETFCRRSAAQ